MTNITSGEIPVEESPAKDEVASPRRGTWGFLAVILLIGLLAGHFYCHLGYIEHGHASPDADGYYAQGRMIATQAKTGFTPESPLQHIGVHWLETEKGRYYSRYPAGLPTLLAAAWWAGGPDAPFYLDSVLATLTLLFLFLLCRPWVGSWLALMAALVYAAHPHANAHAHLAFAHTSATFFLVAGLWLLDAWARSPAGWKILGAGFLLGVVPTIRYAEAVAALGIGVFLVWNVLRDRSRLKDLLLAGVGTAIPIGALLAHNMLAFGSPMKTGYALTNEQTSFSWDWFQQHFAGNVDSLMTGGAGLFFALGLVGLVGMICKRDSRPLGICLLLVIVAVTGVYTAYYFGMGSLRFFLPTLPLYLLPAMWVFSVIRPRGIAAAGVIVLTALHLGGGIVESRDRMASHADRTFAAAESAKKVEELVPAGSVVIADRRMNEMLHYLGRWKLAQIDVARGADRGFGGRANRFGSGEDAPNPRQEGKADQLRAKYRDMADDERYIEVLADLHDWAGEANDTYWIGSERGVADFTERTYGAAQFEKVGEFEVTPRPSPDEDGAAEGERSDSTKPGATGVGAPSARPATSEIPGPKPEEAGAPRQDPRNFGKGSPGGFSGSGFGGRRGRAGGFSRAVISRKLEVYRLAK